MGRRRGGGPSGLLVVDKPEGPTSFDVVAKLRRALRTRTVGHTGTLDPLASGVMVILVGTYTRLSAHLTNDDKRYVASVEFGRSTTTDDREGETVAEGDPSALVDEDVIAAARSLEGPQRQQPPAFSAISVDGERLYVKARRGEAVEAPLRDVVVRRVEVLGWAPPRLELDVTCSKGTYIRSLARDLGAAVGVPAHLAGLRRTAAGAYLLEDATALDALLEPEVALEKLRTGPAAIRMPSVALDEEAAASLRQGKRIPAPTPHADGVHLAHLGEVPVALVERDADTLRVVRGFGGE